MGLGGLADGIVFHQLLQSHSMLSAKIERTTVVGLETNMFWDGVFHASVGAMVVLGLAGLWEAVHGKLVSVPTRILVGGLALGWGLFNLAEGIINHHLLDLHHVVESANPTYFDWGLSRVGRSLDRCRPTLNVLPQSELEFPFAVVSITTDAGIPFHAEPGH
jgi:uncharacterized membrane protein